MKKITKICLFIFTVLLVNAYSSFSKESCAFKNMNIDEISEECLVSAGIDTLDTIYFDLSAINTNGIQVEIPVYFKSDDSVFAMDFSFKYNGGLFSFDSITSVQSNFQYLFNFTPFDSTVYFTSYSLGLAYQNNSDVVNARFNLLGTISSLSPQDIHHALGYLNGDVCPVKVIPPSSTSLFAPSPSSLVLAPNPTNSMLYFSPESDGRLTITGLDGKHVVESVFCSAFQEQIIDLSKYSNGVYIASFKSVNGSILQSRVVLTK